MISTTKEMKRTILIGLVPVLAAAVLASFALISCDAGDAPAGPTDVAAAVDSLFDEAGSGVTTRVSPGTVTVPNPTTGSTSAATLIAVYKDANQKPVKGVQMNFRNDSNSNCGTTGTSKCITFDPTNQKTDSRGSVSTTVVVAADTTSGSYALTAYTSPASTSANASAQTTLKVNVTEVVSAPTMNVPTTPLDTDAATDNIIDATVNFSASGATSTFGGALQYQFECNSVQQGWLAAGVTSSTCAYVNQAGSTFTIEIRAQARSATTLVTSGWSSSVSVIVDDLP